MRAAFKLLRGIWHVLVGWVTIYFRFPQLSQQQRDARVQVWAMQLLRIWGIDLEVRGQPVIAGPALLVCNHISRNVIANQQGWARNHRLPTHFQINAPNAQQLHGPHLHARITLLLAQLWKPKINGHPPYQHVPNATQQFEGCTHR